MTSSWKTWSPLRLCDLAAAAAAAAAPHPCRLIVLSLLSHTTHNDLFTLGGIKRIINQFGFPAIFCQYCTLKYLTASHTCTKIQDQPHHCPQSVSLSGSYCDYYHSMNLTDWQTDDSDEVGCSTGTTRKGPAYLSQYFSASVASRTALYKYDYYYYYYYCYKTLHYCGYNTTQGLMPEYVTTDRKTTQNWQPRSRISVALLKVSHFLYWKTEYTMYA